MKNSCRLISIKEVKFAFKIALAVVIAVSLSACETPLYGQSSLSRVRAEAIALKTWNHKRSQLKVQAENVWSNALIRFREYQMPFAYRIFGEKPADGRSLYFSLHGGGNAPPEINDQQWVNQRSLYNIKEGLCIVPRAPTNTWNLWHEDHIDNFFDSLIRYAIILEEVNPNKVYLLGYSAGGDGVYQLATRMADRWAAASMMAGHPGDANAANLRNLPFAIYMGGKDSAYHRNTLAADFNKRLDSLQHQDPSGYIHETTIYPDKAHWMDRRDTVAIEWMAAIRRNHKPDKVVWNQDNRVQNYCYWLSVPASDTGKMASAEVSISGNKIYITTNTFDKLFINLNDELLDLDKEVSVIQSGRIIFQGKLKRTSAIIRATVEEYQDPVRIYSARLIVEKNMVTAAD
jgi:pimeloyl-ACP methyl ester carboxylesterase